MKNPIPFILAFLAAMFVLCCYMVLFIIFQCRNPKANNSTIHTEARSIIHGKTILKYQ